MIDFQFYWDYSRNEIQKWKLEAMNLNLLIRNVEKAPLILLNLNYSLKHIKKDKLWRLNQ